MHLRRSGFGKILPTQTVEERPMDSEEIRELRAVLGRLKQEHRDLDSAINALEQSGRADALQLKRLKKKKLFLRDEIFRIEDELLPDIIA